MSGNTFQWPWQTAELPLLPETIESHHRDFVAILTGHEQPTLELEEYSRRSASSCASLADYLSLRKQVEDYFDQLGRQLEYNARASQWLTSPLRTFPSEILQKIFTYATEEGCIIGDQFSFPALTLLQVCSRWRQEVEACPRLWEKISVIFTDYRYYAELQDATTKRLEKTLQALLDRSVDAPLYICLYFNRISEGHLNFYQAPKMLRSLCVILSTSSQRWSSLDIRIDDRSSGAVFRGLETIEGNLSALRFLSLHLQYMYENDIDRPTALFRCAPNLHDVELRYQARTDYLGLPWGQVHSLRIIECNCLYSTIRACGELRELCIVDGLRDYKWRLDSSDRPQDGKPVMTSIESLTIWFDELYREEEIMKTLLSPDLKELKLEMEGEKTKVLPRSLHAQSVIDFLSVSSATITSLTISVPICLVDLIRFLGFTVALTHLHLESTYDLLYLEVEEQNFSSQLDALFRALLGPNPSSADSEYLPLTAPSNILIPNLRQLYLIVPSSSNFRFPHSEFIALLHSRRQDTSSDPNVAKLTTVCIQAVLPSDVPDVDDITRAYEALIKGGLKLTRPFRGA